MTLILLSSLYSYNASRMDFVIRNDGPGIIRVNRWLNLPKIPLAVTKSETLVENGLTPYLMSRVLIIPSSSPFYEFLAPL